MTSFITRHLPRQLPVITRPPPAGGDKPPVESAEQAHGLRVLRCSSIPPQACKTSPYYGWFMNQHESTVHMRIHRVSAYALLLQGGLHLLDEMICMLLEASDSVWQCLACLSPEPQ